MFRNYFTTVVLSFLCMTLFYTAIAQPVKMHGRLKVIGTQLVDEHNRPYALHGMSLGWSCWWPRFYNSGTVDWLYRDWNCSVIRAAMAIEPEGGYDDNPAGSRKLIETVVDAAIHPAFMCLSTGMAITSNWMKKETFFTQWRPDTRDIPMLSMRFLTNQRTKTPGRSKGLCGSRH